MEASSKRTFVRLSVSIPYLRSFAAEIWVSGVAFENLKQPVSETIAA